MVLSLDSVDRIDSRDCSNRKNRKNDSSPVNPVSKAVKACSHNQWLAKLQLQFEQKPRGTRLTQCRHVGPLYVQKPFYPEGNDLAHAYLLHPPGGLVSGDHLQIDINVLARARALITTPGAARIYRARDTEPLQRQQVRLVVGENASLEWFPLETIVYNQAHVELDTKIHLSAGSDFMGWEVNCLGLPASDALFDSGSFQQRYGVFRDGRALFIDRFSLTDRNRQALLAGSAGMQAKTVSGFFLAGPWSYDSDDQCLQERLQCLRQVVQDRKLNQFGAISKTGEFYVGRYLGHSAEQARALFAAWWEILRPVSLKRKACPPRIWST